jgi:hypothetical protein
LKLDGCIYERNPALKAGLCLSKSGSRLAKFTALYRAACGGVLGINADAEINKHFWPNLLSKTVYKVLPAMPLRDIIEQSESKFFIQIPKVATGKLPNQTASFQGQIGCP